MQTEDVQAYAEEQGLLFNEISAKQDIGVRRAAFAPPSSVRQLPRTTTLARRSTALSEPLGRVHRVGG